MKHLPRIKACMTPFPYSIEDNASLEEAAAQMQAHNIRHLPVLEDGQLAGIVRYHDIHIFKQGLSVERDQSKLTVDDVCVSGVYAVDLNESLDNVLVHMAQHHIDCTLVTKKGKLVGLFTVTDACSTFAKYLRDQFLPGGGNDAA